MTRARDIANLVDANGDIVAGALDNVPAADVVNDTTPQLGGNLDLNSNDITGTGNIDVTGTVTADDNITLEGASTPRVKLTDTTNTAEAFLEAGNTVARVGSLSNHSFEIRANNDLAIEVKNNGDITFFGDDEVTQGLRWDASTQRLGLGTTSPSVEFEIASSAPQMRITDTDTNAVFQINASSTTGGVELQADATNVGSNPFMAFDVGGSEKVRILDSGNVGIGTSSPTGFSGYTSLDINNATSGAIIDLSQGDSMKGRLIATSSTMAIETSSSVPIIFQPTGTEAMRIDSSGNVGIGEANPSTALDVNGTVTATSFAGDGSNLTGVAAGATGGGSDEIFYENGQTVTTNYTITNGKNAMSAGPISINTGVTVTVGAGETWTVV